MFKALLVLSSFPVRGMGFLTTGTWRRCIVVPTTTNEQLKMKRKLLETSTSNIHGDTTGGNSSMINVATTMTAKSTAKAIPKSITLSSNSSTIENAKYVGTM